MASTGPRARLTLLIAATAERERLVILCEDRDYLSIAAVTGQPVKIITET